MTETNLEDLYDALDVQDKRAYPFSDFEAFFEWESKSFPYDEEIMFDQWGYPSCTRHAITLISNAENINEYRKHGKKYGQIDPLKVWLRSNKVKSLQAAMDQLFKEGLLKAYLMIDRKWEEGIAQIKKAIDFGCFVYTGSSNGDWYTTGKAWKYTTQWRNFAGHAWGIVWYNDDTREFKCITSFWADYWDKWYFYVDYEDIFANGMYSKHVCVDVDNSSNFVDSIEKQWAKQIVRDCKRLYENAKDIKVLNELKQTANFFRTTYKFTDADL